METFNPNIRTTRPDWLTLQAQYLVQNALRLNNASFLIYACLEARLALEKSDLDIVLVSIPAESRDEIIELSKTKNGIDKQGRKIGALKERYQLFVTTLFEAIEVKANLYDFKRSKELQNELSYFIHSYHFFYPEMTADFDVLSPIPQLVQDTEDFLRSSFKVEGEGHAVKGIEIASLPAEDFALLQEWKDNTKMTREELLEKLITNRDNRRKIKKSQH